MGCRISRLVTRSLSRNEPEGDGIMKTVEINISIPVSDKYSHSPSLILKLIAEIIEDRVTEIDDQSQDEDETVADMHGFGGSTLTLSRGELIEEICL